MKLLRAFIAAALLANASAAPAIDLLVQATTQAQILAALKARGLAQDVTDAQLGTATVPVPGVADFVWWQGTGKFLTDAPATYLPGFVMLVRIYDPADAIANPADGEQWSRSRVVQYVKNNGTPGTLSISGCAPINYYAIGQFKVTRFADVSACLAAKGLPGHEWAGGNAP